MLLAVDAEQHAIHLPRPLLYILSPLHLALPLPHMSPPFPPLSLLALSSTYVELARGAVSITLMGITEKIILGYTP